MAAYGRAAQTVRPGLAQVGSGRLVPMVTLITVGDGGPAACENAYGDASELNTRALLGLIGNAAWSNPGWGHRPYALGVKPTAPRAPAAHMVRLR